MRASVFRLAALLALITVATGAKQITPRLWVKRPGKQKLIIVDSLARLCAENELDEEAMMAVVRGEVDDHKGWECGELDCDDGDEDENDDVTGGSEAEADSEKETKEGDSEEEQAEPAVQATPPAPALGSKMIVGMVAPMIGVQLMKRFDETKPEFLLGLRGVYTGAVVVHTLIDLLLQQIVVARNDLTPVKEDMNPIMMLLGGSQPAGPQTAKAYDLAQLGKARNSFRMGVVVVALLHWKFKWNQMLVYQAVQILVELFYSPLVQIHLLGRPTVGPLSRPFGSGGPDMAALFKQMAGASNAVPAASS